MSDGTFFAQAPLLGLNISFVKNIFRFNHVTEANVVGKTLECNVLHIKLIAKAVIKFRSNIFSFIFICSYEFNEY